MAYTPNEPKGFFDGFTLWDWFVIFICSDLMSSGVFVLFSGMFPWALVLGSCIWWLHEFNIQTEIAAGRR